VLIGMVRMSWGVKYAQYWRVVYSVTVRRSFSLIAVRGGTAVTHRQLRGGTYFLDPLQAARPGKPGKYHFSTFSLPSSQDYQI
jgi:hypothetical protein